MRTVASDALDSLAVSLIARSAWFTRRASRLSGGQRSLVALRVLSNLQMEGPLRVGELARNEFVTQPAMTATVNRLESEGLVVRCADPLDGRASIVQLTDEGATVLESFRRDAAAHVRPGLEQLDPDDVAVLTRASELLEQLAAATRGNAT
jgi:DNA-binding MarR family transcriptional regulator